MATRHIVAIGSINMDLVCRTPHMPSPGQTILGKDLVTIPGGKGANQAVAAARLAGPDVAVHMIGRVGSDDFGLRLLNGLERHNVVCDHITVTEGVSSGCALILVDRKGENSIVVAPGANAHLTPADINAAEGLLRSASAVVLQLEIPMKTVQHAIALCQRLGVYTILDPAPAPEKGLPRGVWNVDVLTPNQSEAEILLGGDVARGRARRARRVDAKQIGSDLLSRGPRRVILKLGSRGAMLVGRDEQTGRDQVEHIRGFKVDVVDTTAAGDAFTGALAVAQAEGMSPPQAVRFANAAGAITCQTFGAQPALPTREQVNELLG